MRLADHPAWREIKDAIREYREKIYRLEERVNNLETENVQLKRDLEYWQNA